MLKIRSEQMQAFDKAAKENFTDEMIAHVKEFSPRHAAILGEKGMPKIVRDGLDRAAKYNFTLRGPARLYLELMFLLGSEFDTDPQYPWAAEMLKEATKHNQMQQAERLQRRTMEFITAAAGPEREHARAARQRLLQEKLESVPGPGPTFEAKMLDQLARVHPEKHRHVGAPALRRLIAHGQQEAGKHGLSSGPGPGLVVGLMFGLGHGCLRDPLFPWIGNTLTNPEIKDAVTRTERLASKAKTYFEQAMA